MYRQHVVNECRQITPQMLQNMRQCFKQNLYYCMEIGDQQSIE